MYFILLVREQLKEFNISYEKSENNLKALQSVGQIVGEILKQLTEEKYIVKATNGPRYVVGIRRGIDKAKLRQGTRVALDMTTLTIMRMLPREVDPLVYNMSHEDPGNISYAQIGGLSEQIRELREVCIFYFLLFTEKECVFVNSALKIQCHVKNTLLQTAITYDSLLEVQVVVYERQIL